MRTYEGFLTLIEELNGDMVEIERIQSHNSRAWDRIESGACDILDFGALAYTIHTIYGVIENYFLRISKFFENSLPKDSWHKNLVEKMALNIPGVRPAFLQDRSVKNKVLELLRFRHKFRNMYGEDLNPDRMIEIQRQLEEILDVFPSLHQDYCNKLRKTAELL
ncbi:MAG: hypothetical protein HN368_10080 [Spirochaetales bacterium]|jgi:hypothetical protein|nr:hypothetical protein [Spirochaetales bacterium]